MAYQLVLHVTDGADWPMDDDSLEPNHICKRKRVKSTLRFCLMSEPIRMGLLANCQV